MRLKAAHLCLAVACAMIPIMAHAVQNKRTFDPQVKLGNPASWLERGPNKYRESRERLRRR